MIALNGITRMNRSILVAALREQETQPKIAMAKRERS
jgi:hypothetical protein